MVTSDSRTPGITHSWHPKPHYWSFWCGQPPLRKGQPPFKITLLDYPVWPTVPRYMTTFLSGRTFQAFRMISQKSMAKLDIFLDKVKFFTAQTASSRQTLWATTLSVRQAGSLWSCQLSSPQHGSSTSALGARVIGKPVFLAYCPGVEPLSYG